MTASPIPRRDLNILVKRLDRIIEKLNDTNTIVMRMSDPFDPCSWQIRALIRDGGAVLRTLTPGGRRVVQPSESFPYIPCRVGRVSDCVDVRIAAGAGGVRYSIHKSADLCQPCTDVEIPIAPLNIAKKSDLDIGGWLANLYPSQMLWSAEPVKYHFVTVDAKSFLASLVTTEINYKNISEILNIYLGEPIKKEPKLIGRICK